MVLCEPHGGQRVIYEERAAVCRARGRRHSDLRGQGPLSRAAGEPHGLHAPLPLQHPPGFPRAGNQRGVGGDRRGRHGRQTGVVSLHRDLAPAPQPLQRAARRQGQAPPHAGRRLLLDRTEPGYEILHLDLLERLDAQPRGGVQRRGQYGPHALRQPQAARGAWPPRDVP